MKLIVVMTKDGLEELANGRTSRYGYVLTPAEEWKDMKPYYDKQGGTKVGEVELALPSREEAVKAILPFMDAEKAAIMEKAWKECAEVDERKQSVLALEAPKPAAPACPPPTKVTPFPGGFSNMEDDFPF